MARSYTRQTFGVCGNFRLEIWDLTDVKATRSIVKPMMDRIRVASSTNTSDNADVFNAKTLSWTGTAAVDQENHLEDTGEVFEAGIDGQIVYNTETGDAKQGLSARVNFDSTDTDDLSLVDLTSSASNSDLFPDGNEDYAMKSERVVQVLAATAGDDGTLLLIGE